MGTACTALMTASAKARNRVMWWAALPRALCGFCQMIGIPICWKSQAHKEILPIRAPPGALPIIFNYLCSPSCRQGLEPRALELFAIIDRRYRGQFCVSSHVFEPPEASLRIARGCLRWRFHVGLPGASQCANIRATAYLPMPPVRFHRSKRDVPCDFPARA
jgi:hypothetical protein